MAHYDCYDCGKPMGISAEYCSQCRAKSRGGEQGARRREEARHKIKYELPRYPFVFVGRANDFVIGKADGQ